MIDWYNLFANSLWIFALALALASLSLARWEAITQGNKLWDTLSGIRWQKPLHIAGIFFCGGLVATSGVLWERILWLVLLIMFILQTGMMFFPRRNSEKNDKN